MPAPKHSRPLIRSIPGVTGARAAIGPWSRKAVGLASVLATSASVAQEAAAPGPSVTESSAAPTPLEATPETAPVQEETVVLPTVKVVGEAESYHYQLVGGSDLQAMVGKEVKVTGDVLGKGKDVDVKRTEKSVEAPATGARDAQPAVKTTEEIEMQVEQLHVDAISATGNSCQAAR